MDLDVRIVYYSRKGSTERLAGMVAEGFRSLGHEAMTVPIRHVKRPGFLSAGRMSMKDQEVELANDEADYDLGMTDIIIIGGPVFAGRVNPYTKTYLRRVSGLEGKPCGVFITCDSRTEDADGYVRELAEVASQRGLVVRSRMIGSRKAMERFQAMARSFVEEVLGVDSHEIGGESDDGGGNGDDGDGGDGDGGDGGDGE